jgi:hypothetical protein
LKALLILLLLFAAPALADVEMRSSVGSAVTGQIQTQTTAKVSAYPLALALQYEGKFFGALDAMVGLTFQHQMLSYKEEGATFSGTNLLVGPTTGLTIKRFASSLLRTELGFYPYSSLVVTSDTEGEVNGESYKHSSLTTYSGPYAYEAKIAYLIEKKDGQFNKRERLRYGFYVAQIGQKVTKEVVKVATSNSDIAPRTTTTRAVDYSLSLTAVGFCIGFAF